MRTSVAGRAAIKRREGERLTAYRDSVNVLTIGVGHTTAAGPPTVTAGMKITAQQSDEILARDLADVENDLTAAVKVPINQNQFDALASLHFNIGPGSFRSSTLLRKLNAKDYAGAADQFLVWNKGTIDGKKVAIDGLTIRRKEERAQFLSTTVASAPEPAPVPKPIATIDEPQAPLDHVPVTPAPSGNWLAVLTKAIAAIFTRKEA
ncbi:lysozyme [Rhizobium sp. BK060]|uniref:lysozyme n=1 Tax=Rhizobium sp. BK060 TaxID=2587096 RepID=UPI00160B5168|nr:lysozyme [Rhizobium sp. BK060]MBB3396889.1 lysozyme [Rhizobium sp. BK060]